jgi:hypothetical protein
MKRAIVIVAASTFFLLACGKSSGSLPSIDVGDVYVASKSGTRLHAQFVTTPDGTRSFTGWVDTARNGERCAFARAADGVIRCLPLVDDCTGSVDSHYQCTSKPACPVITISNASGEIPPTAFVGATPRRVSIGTVDAVLFDADDGTTAFGHFADPTDGFACVFATAGDNARACVPLDVAPRDTQDVGGVLFTDAQCKAAALGGQYVISDACDDVRFTEGLADAAPFAKLGDPTALSNLYVGNPQYQTCDPAKEPVISLRPVGDGVPMSAFVSASAAPLPAKPGTRLSPIALDLGGGHWVEDRAGALGSALGDYGSRFGTFTDSALGRATCAFVATTAGLRCVPRDTSSEDGYTLYSDDKCTAAIGEHPWRTTLAENSVVVAKVFRGKPYTSDVVFTTQPQGGCMDTGSGCPCVKQARSELPTDLYAYDEVPLTTLDEGTLTTQ